VATTSPFLLLLAKLSQREKLKFQKIENEVNLEIFNLQKVRGKNSKNHQVFYKFLKMCSQKYRRMIEDLYFIPDL